MSAPHRNRVVELIGQGLINPAQLSLWNTIYRDPAGKLWVTEPWPSRTTISFFCLAEPPCERVDADRVRLTVENGMAVYKLLQYNIANDGGYYELLYQTYQPMDT